MLLNACVHTLGISACKKLWGGNHEVMIGVNKVMSGANS